MIKILNKTILFSLIFVILFLPLVNSAVQCSSTCLTSQQVAQETVDYQNQVSGSKCLFIYDNKVYLPPTGSISNNMHKNAHSCGADVTGIMKQSHINSPNSYLVPYICAPLCSGQQCQDSDSDGSTASSCGGNDCNDNNPNVHLGATETCNNIDDNCNSIVDENLNKQVTCGVGACLRTITQTCSAGNYLPNCVPGQGVTEICSNSVDDNCNGQTDESCGSCTSGTIQTCGINIGNCKSGNQTCSSSGNWGSCIGSVDPVREICGNNIDDDCNGVIDDNCNNNNPIDNNTGNTNSNTNTKTNSNNVGVFVNTSLCKPKCIVKCGQGNQCGGNCSDIEKNDPLKCQNYSCFPKCSGAMCGQKDGCGGLCLSYDKNSCGLCGNKPCCTEEICDNKIDDNCNNQIDEGCDFQSSLKDIILGKNKNIGLMPINEKKHLFILESMFRLGVLARGNGLLAFIFAGFTIIIGLFRLSFMKYYSRERVIRFHTFIGLMALFFIFLHLGAVLLDKGGWAETVKFVNVIFPTFSNSVIINLSLGVIGMYLFFITILSGVFFGWISKKIGHNLWLILHRTSYIFYIFIFIHAYNLGTDFKNPYVLVLFSQLLAIVILYLIFKVFNPIILTRETRIKIQKMTNTRFELNQILKNTKLVNKIIYTSGLIEKVELKNNINNIFFKLTESDESIYLKSDIDIVPDYYQFIKVLVRESENKIFLEVIQIKK